MINEQVKELAEKAGLKLDATFLEKLSTVVEEMATNIAEGKVKPLEEKLQSEHDAKIVELETEHKTKTDAKIAELDEKIESNKGELVEKLKDWTDKVSETIKEDNKFTYQHESAIESAKKIILNQRESIIEFNIDKDEFKKSDVVESEELKNKYNTSVEDNIAMGKKLAKAEKTNKILVKTKGMSEDQVDAIKSLTKDVEMNENFDEKLDTFIKLVKNEKQETVVEGKQDGIKVDSVNEGDEIKVKQPKKQNWMNKY